MLTSALRKRRGAAEGGADGAATEGDGGGAEGAGGRRRKPRTILGSLVRLCIGAAFALYIQRRNAEFDESGVPSPEEDFHIVDKGDNIAEYEAFLSDAEVKYLLAFVEGLGWGASSAPEAELPVEGYIAAARMDPVISRIEKRIANITGVPAHPHEDILSIVPEEGGRIIFPVAGPAPRDGELSERHRQFHRGLQEQYGGAKQNYSRSVRFDPSLEHPFMDLIEESCRGSYGVAVTPKPGSALLFPSDSASRRTWYGECNVINGSKVTLQKFKELPLAQRDPEDPVPPYQPWRFE